MANGHGGARPGAGRKPKSERFGPAIIETEATIEKLALHHVPRSLQELVDGHYREETNKDGTTRIYTVSPSITAIQEVLNRMMGKPTQGVELTGEDGGHIRLRWESRQDDDDDPSPAAAP